MKGRQFLSRAWHLYYDGFRNLSPTGKQLWILIAVKLVLIFVVMKLLFFPDTLHHDYDNDEQRSQAVRTSLLDPARQQTE